MRHARLPQLWRALAQTLRLPDTLPSFLLFTFVVIVVSSGLLLHLQLSTTILQDKVQLQQLQVAEQVIEEENSNLVWAIVQETELNKVKERAIALGYQPALQREYLVVPSDTLATDLQSTIIAQSGE